MSENGQPVIHLGGLTITILDELRLEADNNCESNLLNCGVEVTANGAVVRVQNEHIETSELKGFALSLSKIYDTLKGECELAPLGANFRAKVTIDGLGHLGVAVVISPDWGSQAHEFKFQTDQSCLPSTLGSIWEVLDRYPF